MGHCKDSAFIPGEIETWEWFTPAVRDENLTKMSSRENGRREVGNGKNQYFPRLTERRREME